MNKIKQHLLFIVTIIISYGCAQITENKEIPSEFNFNTQESMYLVSKIDDFDYILKWRSSISADKASNSLLGKLNSSDSEEWIVLQTFRVNPKNDKTIIFHNSSSDNWKIGCDNQFIEIDDKSAEKLISIIDSIDDRELVYDISLESLHPKMYYLTIKQKDSLRRLVILDPSLSAGKVFNLDSDFDYLTKIVLGFESIVRKQPSCK